MKKITLLLLVILIGMPIGILADSRINLTPVPMQMTVGEGKLILPESFTISTGDLEEGAVAEAVKFSGLFSTISGYEVSLTDNGDAFMTMRRYNGEEELGDEGYTLDITADGIAITANSASGFYYAFQSIKKMLPANIMAEVKDNSVTEYSLPIVSIVDAPRFEYHRL